MFLVRDGQLNQLRHLFDRHNVKLYNYFVMLTGDRSVSEDLTQDVFLRMLRFRHTFKGEGSFISWMFQIARNIGVDHYRKNRNFDPLGEKHLHISDEEPTPLDESIKKQQVEILHQALRTLSPKHREVILMARFADLSLKEMARILRCPVNSAKVKVHRAVKALGAIYAELTEVQQDVV
ncbi:sigma-70 family RNA polymerase sigma factor [candidate division KSB1 bacterium]|nr:sigma-70 family RNA polymerase sigma factor [candidate division KSB1 bacterium]RQW05324.1 MAG: sigma-70 family RNA polymerase sigma factor [candidate division KSB1 bacterium]